MVIAYHLVWTAYGWWLPNDPRGSMSHHVEQNVLRDLGELPISVANVSNPHPARSERSTKRPKSD